jgi:hypothetical protein
MNSGFNQFKYNFADKKLNLIFNSVGFGCSGRKLSSARSGGPATALKSVTSEEAGEGEHVIESTSSHVYLREIA